MSEVYGNLPETLPQYVIKTSRLLGINDAIKTIHFPQELDDFKTARRRLVFEELLITQLSLMSLKNRDILEEKGIQFSSEYKIEEFVKRSINKCTIKSFK